MNKQLDYLNVAWEMWKKRSLFPQSKFWIQVNPKKSKIYIKKSIPKKNWLTEPTRKSDNDKRVKYFSLRNTAAATTALQLSKNTSKKAPKNLSLRKLSNQIATP